MWMGVGIFICPVSQLQKLLVDTTYAKHTFDRVIPSLSAHIHMKPITRHKAAAKQENHS